MTNKFFQRLILSLEQKRNFNRWLIDRNKQYSITTYNILKLKSSTVVQIYSALLKKFSKSHTFSRQEVWHKNQIRIFIWLLFAYAYVFQKNIYSFVQQDWNFFSQIFNNKKTQQFEFQAKLLIKQNIKLHPWSIEEITILKSIMNDNQYKEKWNKISKEIFFRTNKLCFHSPKQCRQQWKNHIDPSKNHSKWTQFEDLTLFQCINANGKKWSLVVNVLNQTRTEHMVKNRYKSLIKKQQKRHKRSLTQNQIQCILIKKLTKLIIKKGEFQKQSKQEEKFINFDNNISNQFEGQKECKDLFNHQFFEDNKQQKIDNSIFDTNSHQNAEDIIQEIDTLLRSQTSKQQKIYKFNYIEDLNNVIILNMQFYEESNQQKEIFRL